MINAMLCTQNTLLSQQKNICRKPEAERFSHFVSPVLQHNYGEKKCGALPSHAYRLAEKKDERTEQILQTTATLPSLLQMTGDTKEPSVIDTFNKIDGDNTLQRLTNLCLKNLIFFTELSNRQYRTHLQRADQKQMPLNKIFFLCGFAIKNIMIHGCTLTVCLGRKLRLLRSRH